MNIRFYLSAFILAGFFLLLLSGCASVYLPPFYHEDISYHPKPHSGDSIKSRTYLSAQYFDLSTPREIDEMRGAAFYLSRGHTFRNINLSYGISNTTGTYMNGNLQPSDPYYFNGKPFGVFSSQVGFNFFNANGKYDFRYIGFETAFSHEYGSYSSFRRMISRQNGNYFADPSVNLYTMGITWEFLYRSTGPAHTKNGLKIFLGSSLGDHQGYNAVDFSPFQNSGNTTYPLFFKVSFFTEYRRFFQITELSPLGFRFNLGYTF